jgi:hypothetical protein
MIVDGISLNLPIIIFFTFGYFEKYQILNFYREFYLCLTQECVPAKGVETEKIRKRKFYLLYQ